VLTVLLSAVLAAALLENKPTSANEMHRIIMRAIAAILNILRFKNGSFA
jgi:hypothetical protein